MSTMSTGQKALADVFESEFSPDPHREREPMELELARLKEMSLIKAVRQLGWRLIQAFTQEDPRALVFWALTTAALFGGDSCSDLLSDFARIMGQSGQQLS